ALQIDLEEKDWSGVALQLQNLSGSLGNLQRRAESMVALSLARELAEAVEDEDGVTSAIFCQTSDAIYQGRFAEAETLFAAFHERPHRQPPQGDYLPGDEEYSRCRSQFFQGKLTDVEWQAGHDLAVRHRNVRMQFWFLALRAQWDLGEDRPERAL